MADLDWKSIPQEVDPAVPLFVNLLRILVLRVAHHVSATKLSVGKAFANTALYHHEKHLIHAERDGAPLRGLSRDEFWKIIPILQSARYCVAPSERIALRCETDKLVLRFPPYRLAMDELDQNKHKRIVRPAHDTSAAWKIIEARRPGFDLYELAGFRNFVWQCIELPGREGRFVDALRTAAALQLLLKTEATSFHVSPKMQLTYRALLAWKGAWTAYMGGNSELERLFVDEMATIHREAPDELIARRIITHVGYYNRLSPERISRMATPTQSGWFELMQPGHEALRLSAMKAIQIGQCPMDRSHLLNDLTPFAALDQAWRRQRDDHGYMDGARMALGSFMRRLVAAGEIEKAMLLLSEADKLNVALVDNYATARLESAKGLVLLVQYANHEDWTALRDGDRAVTKAIGTFEAIGNRAKASVARYEADMTLRREPHNLIAYI